MTDLTHRVAALESMFSRVNLGDWSNDQDVPWWLAIRILPQQLELRAQLVSTVQLMAQTRLGQEHGGGNAQLLSEIIDDWCGTPPRRFPPRPHWGSILEQLAMMSEDFPAGSAMQSAALELAGRVIERARKGKARAG